MAEVVETDFTGSGAGERCNRAERHRETNERSELSKVILDDLAKSGLNAEDAELLGIGEVRYDELRDRFGSAIAARSRKAPVYRIPYPDTDLGRYKFLDGNSPKYLQEKGTAPRLYFPPLGKLDCKNTLSDPEIDLYCVEGEKKAAAMRKNGFETFGVGGVDCWGAKKLGQILLPDFDLIALPGRKVRLLFDSDAASNPNVLRALFAFAKALSDRGALPEYAIPPNAPDGSKQGADDLIVSGGPEAIYKLDWHKFSMVEAAWQLNTQFACLRNPIGSILVLRDGQITDFSRLKQDTAPLRVLAEVNGKVKQIPAADFWNTWPLRLTYSGLDYVPDGPRELTDGSYNLWSGWGCDSLAGDVSAWRDLLDHLFRADPVMRVWAEHWIAFPIQHPGSKLMTALVLHGVQGSGKTLLLEVLRLIYGEANSYTIGNSELGSRFNGWAAQKQLICAEEVSGADRRHDANRIKALITGSNISIEEKYVPAYELPNRANFIFASNSKLPLFMSEDDRRFAVCDVTEVLDHRRGREIKLWAEDGGAAAIRHHLERLDLETSTPTRARR